VLAGARVARAGMAVVMEEADGAVAKVAVMAVRVARAG
jgi:hypothetical protein